LTEYFVDAPPDTGF